jgi:hypothetical protein
MRRITAPKSPRSVGRFDAKQATMDAMSEAAAREQKRVALVGCVNWSWPRWGGLIWPRVINQ